MTDGAYKSIEHQIIHHVHFTNKWKHSNGLIMQSKRISDRMKNQTKIKRKGDFSCKIFDNEFNFAFYASKTLEWMKNYQILQNKHKHRQEHGDFIIPISCPVTRTIRYASHQLCSSVHIDRYLCFLAIFAPSFSIFVSVSIFLFLFVVLGVRSFFCGCWNYFALNMKPKPTGLQNAQMIGRMLRIRKCIKRIEKHVMHDACAK